VTDPAPVGSGGAAPQLRRGGLALVRFGSLGDVILATAAASRVRRRRPEMPVVFVTRHACASVLFRHLDVDRVVVMPPRTGDLAGLSAVARQLREAGVAGIVDLHASWRSRLLSALAWPKPVVRYESRALARRLLVRAPALVRGREGLFRPVVEAYLEAVDGWLDRFDARAGAAGPVIGLREPAVSRLAGEPPLPSVHLAPAEVNWAIGELERLEVPPGAIGTAPGARHATKKWPIVYHAELIDRLALRRSSVVPVFLSSSPEDLELETELRRLVRRPEAMRIVRQPLRRAAAMLGRLSALVTNDSGLMHLAAAVGTPVVALFGPTVTEFGFAPAGPGHQVLERPLDCRPCSVHGGPRCPLGHFRCMKETAPEEVLAALDRLDRRRGSTAAGGRSDIER
jgi:ADP-heptose:LPS heptosyltransferase